MEVPDGAAIFPAIPAEINVHPLLLAVVLSIVFLAGSDDEIVLPDAGDEELEDIAGYLQRLDGPDLRRVEEDLTALRAYGEDGKAWPKQVHHFLKTFLADFGVGGESDA